MSLLVALFPSRDCEHSDRVLEAGFLAGCWGVVRGWVCMGTTVIMSRLGNNNDDSNSMTNALNFGYIQHKRPNSRQITQYYRLVIQNGKSSSSTLVHVRYPKPPPSLPISNSRQFLIKGLTISRAIALISSIFFSNFFRVSL